MQPILPDIEITALLGHGTEFEGKLHFAGRVRIDGAFRGEIRGEGVLIVGEGASAQRLRVVEVRIANGPFHGGTELVDGARVDSGEIIVQAVQGNVKRRLLRNWVNGALRREARLEDTVSFSGPSLRIATEPPLPVSIDGEVLAQTPVTARIAPRVIDVMVPAAG